MTDADVIKSLRIALGFARPFVINAAEGRGRWAMAAGGAIEIMDRAMIAADNHMLDEVKPPENAPANKPSVAFGPRRP